MHFLAAIDVADDNCVLQNYRAKSDRIFGQNCPHLQNIVHAAFAVITPCCYCVSIVGCISRPTVVVGGVLWSDPVCENARCRCLGQLVDCSNSALTELPVSNDTTIRQPRLMILTNRFHLFLLLVTSFPFRRSQLHYHHTDFLRITSSGSNQQLPLSPHYRVVHWSSLARPPAPQ